MIWEFQTQQFLKFTQNGAKKKTTQWAAVWNVFLAHNGHLFWMLQPEYCCWLHASLHGRNLTILYWLNPTWWCALSQARRHLNGPDNALYFAVLSPANPCSQSPILPDPKYALLDSDLVTGSSSNMWSNWNSYYSQKDCPGTGDYFWNSAYIMTRPFAHHFHFMEYTQLS